MKQTQAGKERFPHLFTKGKIGKFETYNRIKYAACSISNFCSDDGFFTDKEYGRSEVIAKTGASVLTNQGVYPDRFGEGKTYWRQPALCDDRFIPALMRVATMWRKENPKAVIIQQILHGGRYGGIHLGYCLQPSLVPQTLPHFRPPREMTKEDIHRMIEEHVETSIRSIKAGFDGIEVTGFLGYLISNFNSKFTNQRKDEYGGSLEKRARFMVELIQATKKAIGPDLIFGIRLNGTELLGDKGNSEEECRELMKIAESAGADYISMVIGWHEAPEPFLGRHMEAGGWLYLAEAAKKVVKVPLALGPGFRDPILAEKALAEGSIDYWEMCRPMLADPDLIHRVERNQIEKIRPCIDCLMCISRMFMNEPYLCTVNPVLGHEIEPEYHSKPAAYKKRVMIVGAGPAGVQCAIEAAKKGHWVNLFDQHSELGGQVLVSSKDPAGGTKLIRYLNYLKGVVAELPIDLYYNTKVDQKLVAEFRPDVVVLATGVNFTIPKIPGIDRKNIINIWNLVEDGTKVGNKVVVVGAGKAGSLTARWLASEGKKVTVIEEKGRIDFDVVRAMRWRERYFVQKFGIEALTNSTVREVTEKGVKVQDSAGKERFVEADTVVLAVRESNQDLESQLEELCDELYLIGDAIKPRHLYTSIHEGFKLGIRV